VTKILLKHSFWTPVKRPLKKNHLTWDEVEPVNKHDEDYHNHTDTSWPVEIDFSAVQMNEKVFQAQAKVIQILQNRLCSSEKRFELQETSLAEAASRIHLLENLEKSWKYVRNENRMK
jgi:hypothetical protein